MRCRFKNKQGIITCRDKVSQKGVMDIFLFLVKMSVTFLVKFTKSTHNDAKDILEYCMKSKSENSNFQYTFTLDDENKLEHIFWSPSRCFNWYKKYGDVVVFDTTYFSLAPPKF